MFAENLKRYLRAEPLMNDRILLNVTINSLAGYD